ncbi:MAG: alpha/beta hydrolase [Candidatus Zixiibacteriota bacterium]
MNQNLNFTHEYLPPRNAGNDYTLLLLHGTGGSQFDLIPVGERLLPTSAILSPLGKVTENGMARFFRRLSPGVFDLDDLRFRTTELAEFVKQAASAYNLNRNRMVGAGYSNGANIAASLLLAQPETLRTAVLFRPMVPFVPPKLPNLDGVNILICGGKHDEVVAPEEAVRLAELLHEANAAVSIHWADAGHGLSSQEIAQAREWLGAKLGIKD